MLPVRKLLFVYSHKQMSNKKRQFKAISRA
nr:MAG TPA_asm: hypothetical protein [Caudoviricetes sp.]